MTLDQQYLLLIFVTLVALVVTAIVAFTIGLSFWWPILFFIILIVALERWGKKLIG